MFLSLNSRHIEQLKQSRAVYSYKENVLYAVNQSNISPHLLKECIQNADAIWHFLAVLTSEHLEDVVDFQLTTDKLTHICENASLLIVGAYDGETYVFWERK